MPVITTKFSPVGNFTQYFDNDGLPLSGGKIFTYLAGSFSSLAVTYTSISGGTANANPIVLDSSGRVPNPIWLDGSTLYNFVLTLPNGTTVLMSIDNVGGGE